MPNPKSKLNTKTIKHRRRQVLVGTGVAMTVGLMAIGIGKLLPGSSKLDMSNGVNLLPSDTLLSISISTEPERWQKFTEFGIPTSRAVFEKQLTKFQTDFLTSYGYDYRRDIQPWIGKQILIGYLNNQGATPSKPAQLKIPTQQTIAILPIADRGAAQKVAQQHQTDAGRHRR